MAYTQRGQWNLCHFRVYFRSEYAPRHTTQAHKLAGSLCGGGGDTTIDADVVALRWARVRALISMKAFFCCVRLVSWLLFTFWLALLL